MKFLTVILVIAIALKPSHCKVFTKCEVARQLLAAGIAYQQLPDWMCLVQYESSFNSSAIGGPNTNKTFDWGLFQINDQWWCDSLRPGAVTHNICGVQCKKLVDDDIADDIQCALTIYKRQGLGAWNAWRNKCQGKPLPSVTECFNY